MAYMNTGTTLQMRSISSDDTESLGATIGANLKGGELIELTSDLGGGKTTFTRGLVRGAGSNDKVASPTFTLSREYKAPHFTIVHFDFYRLAEAGIMDEEFAEFIGDPKYVVVVEWGDVVQDVLPTDRLSLTITRTAEGEDVRNIALTNTEPLAYLTEDLQA